MELPVQVSAKLKFIQATDDEMLDVEDYDNADGYGCTEVLFIEGEGMVVKEQHVEHYTQLLEKVRQD